MTTRKREYGAVLENNNSRVALDVGPSWITLALAFDALTMGTAWERARRRGSDISLSKEDAVEERGTMERDEINRNIEGRG